MTGSHPWASQAKEFEFSPGPQTITRQQLEEAMHACRFWFRKEGDENTAHRGTVVHHLDAVNDIFHWVQRH